MVALIRRRTNRYQAFNIVAQSQSQTTIVLSEAARSDAVAMKAIATVTLIFLPATFVSVCNNILIVQPGYQSTCYITDTVQHEFFQFLAEYCLPARILGCVEANMAVLVDYPSLHGSHYGNLVVMAALAT